MKMLLRTKFFMLHWRYYIKSGCTITGLHYENASQIQNFYALLAELCYERVRYSGLTLYVHK